MCSLLPTFLLFLLPFLVLGQNYSECGVSYSENHTDIHGEERIFNGIVSTVGKWPWMVTVCLFRYGRCEYVASGSIVHRNWVLTSGRFCQHPEIYKVGIKGLSLDEVTYVDVRAKNYINYIFPPYGKEICLLKLFEPLSFDNETTPICLSRSSKPKVGDLVTVTGFGFDSTYNPNLRRLREAVLVTSNCSGLHYSSPKADYICTTSINQGINYGDNGGPLMTQKEDGNWVQVGIVSGGERIHKFNNDILFQDVYTNVAHYCDWIKKTTHGEVLCGD